MSTVAPENIASEFAEIWSHLETKQKTRACLFNLIIYSPKDARTEYLSQVAKKVMEKFPCRLLFITVKEGSKELKTQVSVISPHKEDRAVACDLLEIEISKDWQERVPFLILPHFVSDLPIYMVWGEDLTQENPVLTQIEKFVDRTIFDSELSADLQKFAASLLKKKQTFHTDIADLNWARTESWRTLLTAFFYAPYRLEMLENVKKMVITYNNVTTPFFCHCDMQAIYLQGWLANQMQWQAQSSSKKGPDLQCLYKAKNKDIEVVLTPQSHTNLPAGNLLSLELTTHSGDHCQFTRNIAMPNQITIKLSSKEKCDLPMQYLLTKSQVGQSLVREICHKGTSSHYLGMLTKIIESKLTC